MKRILTPELLLEFCVDMILFLVVQIVQYWSFWVILWWCLYSLWPLTSPQKSLRTNGLVRLVMIPHITWHSSVLLFISCWPITALVWNGIPTVVKVFIVDTCMLINSIIWVLRVWYYMYQWFLNAIKNNYFCSESTKMDRVKSSFLHTERFWVTYSLLQNVV